MNITRIMSKKGKITIKYEEFNSTTELPDVRTLESSDLPIPSFSEAFNKLKGHLLTITEMPKDDLLKMHILGADVKYSGEAYLSVQLYGTRDISISKSGHDIKSAWFGYDEKGTNDAKEKNVMPGELYNDLQMVITEALAYLDGDRAQRVLPFEKEEETQADDKIVTM